MSDMDFSRRNLLKTIGASMALTTSGSGVLSPALAQHVHQAVTDDKSLNGGSDYKPKFLNAHEFQTLRRLSDLIIPADEHSKGALDAGAAEFIDFCCSRNEDIAHIYTGGLNWMDDAMRKHHSTSFIDAKPEQQTALLDLLAYKKNDSPEMAAGAHFFAWLRNMVVDAYYTSPVGIKDLGYMGNTAVSHFSVPQEAIDYALKRSPVA